MIFDIIPLPLLVLASVVFTGILFFTAERAKRLEEKSKQFEDRIRKLEAGLRELSTEVTTPSPKNVAAEGDESTPPPPLAKPETSKESGRPKQEVPISDTPAPLPPPPAQAIFSNRDGQTSSSPNGPIASPPKPAANPRPHSQPNKTTPKKTRAPLPWRKMLEAAQLLPPASSGESTEVRLAVWWTTRIGAVLLVIAGVFLGVYVSRDSPTLRLLSMSAISAAVIGAGLWLEKRYQAFGRIVASGGLGLAFVTAFAASAFETTRVIESATLGVLVQLLAIIGMIAWSLWKKDSAVATMALICGYIACAFSHSHDLAHFVVAGLLILGAAGASLLILRRWPAPAMIALGASWCGFFGLIFFDWSISPGLSSPHAYSALACFVLLTLIFHSAGLLFRHRHPELATSRRLRIGTLVNTSLAVVAIYLAGRLVYDHYLATFYLTFSILIFGFAAWHRCPGNAHDRGLATALFLKSMALLALFFVAQFDGPVRWLSLSLQTATLVYIWHKHRSPWILAAIGVGLVGTLGWMCYDLLSADVMLSANVSEWSAFSVRSIVGGLSLLVLTSALSAQNHLANLNRPITEKSSVPIPPIAIPRLVAAFGIVFVAIVLAFSDHLQFNNRAIAPIGFLTVLGLLTFQPLWRWRSIVPIVVGTSTLVVAALAFLTLPSRVGASASGVVLGICLSIVALVGADLARRLWPELWHGGAVVRALGNGFGVIVLTATMNRFYRLQDGGSALAITLLLVLSIVVAGALLMQAAKFTNRHDSGNPIAKLLRWSLGSIYGGCLVGIAMLTHRENSLTPFWLALASLPSFVLIYRTRDGVPAMGAGLALFASWIWMLTENLWGNPALAHSLIITLGVIVINSAVAGAISRRKSTGRAAFFDFWEITLHCASLVLAFAFAHNHFQEPIMFAVSTGIALAALLSGTWLPFRRLAQVSFVPILLATVYHAASGSGGDFDPLAVGWVISLTGLLAFLLAFEYSRRRSQLENDCAKISGALSTFVASLITVAALLLMHCTSTEPWQTAGYVAVALAGALLWRFGKFPHTHAPSTIAIVVSALATIRLCLGASSSTESIALTAGLISASGTLSYGLILCARQRAASWRKLGLIPAAIGTALAFFVFGSSAIGVEQMTTVCWGATSILVFIAGLAGGLRSYRLVGLIGLGVCLVRMFLIDIDDTLYRIIAFFAISVVLLLIGFLYHRFRKHIEAFDKIEE